MDLTGTKAAASPDMGRMLNYVIVLLLVLWLAGMLFAAMLGFMVHLLLLLALVAAALRIHHWWKEKRRKRIAGRQMT